MAKFDIYLKDNPSLDGGLTYFTSIEASSLEEAEEIASGLSLPDSYDDFMRSIAPDNSERNTRPANLGLGITSY